MRTSARRLLAGSLLLLAGCASSGSPVDDQVLLRPSRDAFPAGAPLDLEFWNRSADALGYNACSGLIVERRAVDGWQRVSHQPPGTACTLQMDVLEAGRSTLLRIPSVPAVVAGTYRVRMHVEWPLGGGRVEVRSPEFAVAAS